MLASAQIKKTAPSSKGTKMKLITCILMTGLLALVWSEKIGKKRIIDLTHQLSNRVTVWPLLPPVNISVLVAEQREHFWLEYNMLSLCEHSGTHMDAPVHFSKDNLHVHEIPMSRFIGPGVIIHVTDKARENPDYQMTVDDLLSWEARNGLIPDGAIVIMDSGWSNKMLDPYAMLGTTDITNISSFHFPSIHADTARFIVEHRPQISIVGVDTLSFDAPSSITYPAHVTLLGAGIPCLENVANLEHVPEAGSVIYALPMNVYDGSGAPIRAFAVLNDDVLGTEAFVSSSSVPMLHVAVMFLATALFISLLTCQ